MMRFIKTALLLFCVVSLLLTAACGYRTGNTDDSPVETEYPYDTEPDDSASPGVSDVPDTGATDGETPTAGFDYDAAYAAFAPDTVMLTAGGYDVLWDEFFFNLCSYVAYLGEYGEFSWDDLTYEGTTYAEAALAYAVDYSKSYKAVEFGAEQLGVALNDEDKAAIEADYQEAVESLGGEDVLLERLRDYSHIYSRELFDYLVGMDILISHCFDRLYGENAALITDDIVKENLKDGEYLMAKHILIKESDEGSGEDSGEKSQALIKAESLVKELDEYSGDDFDAFFDELMFSNSEDPGGLSTYPGGYLFTDGTMDPAFYEGCLSLEISSYGIFEGYYGYHIIYRLPVNYDDVPYEYSSQGYTTSIRQIVASNFFNDTATGWNESLSVTFTDAYNSISLADIFKSA